jgi:dihydroorotate dehydrogenase (fumarate)
MTRLATTYLGLELPHPFIVGASPLGDSLDGIRRLEDAGASAVVLHSLYEEQLRTESVATHESVFSPADTFGEALSYLPQPDEFRLGPDAYTEHVSRAAEAAGIPIIASLNGIEPGPWLDYARMLEQAGAAAIELNLYDVVTDPSMTAGDVESRAVSVVRGVREKTSLPVAVKLSPFYTALPNIAGRLVDAGATGLVLFNRFFEPDVNTEELEIVPHLELSRPDELYLRLRWLAVLRGLLRCPLAVSGGVHDGHDAVKAVMCGADAVQLVSVLLERGADQIGVVVKAFEDWLDEHEYDTLAQLRGSMAAHRCPNPAALTRAQYVRTLQTWTPRYEPR